MMSMIAEMSKSIVNVHCVRRFSRPTTFLKGLTVYFRTNVRRSLRVILYAISHGGDRFVDTYIWYVATESKSQIHLAT